MTSQFSDWLRITQDKTATSLERLMAASNLLEASKQLCADLEAELSPIPDDDGRSDEPRADVAVGPWGRP